MFHKQKTQKNQLLSANNRWLLKNLHVKEAENVPFIFLFLSKEKVSSIELLF